MNETDRGRLFSGSSQDSLRGVRREDDVLVTMTFTLKPGRTLMVGWMARFFCVICWPAWLTAPPALRPRAAAPSGW